MICTARAARHRRRGEWGRLGSDAIDVVIVGGGINGAAAYSRLARSGYRTLLAEKGDFAAGTSQASAMMVWGGLLYLAHFELIGALRLSRARERMIREFKARARPSTFDFICCTGSSRPPWLVQSALYFYWLLGGMRRTFPRRLRNSDRLDFLEKSFIGKSFAYQEATLRGSDARFVIDWLLAGPRQGSAALNYCQLLEADYDPHCKLWRLEMQDRALDKPFSIRSRYVVCAAGVWTDRLNQRVGIRTPFRHVFSKGVFLGLRREAAPATRPIVFDSGDNADAMGLIPWGPITLWGPTETIASTIEEGFTPASDDVDFLLDRLNRHLALPVTQEDIVSLRCGVRPLAIDRDSATPKDTLSSSKRFRICPDPNLPWISIYGGKFTSAIELGRRIESLLARRLPPPRPALAPPTPCKPPEAEMVKFPGIDEEVPSPGWCLAQEGCFTLDDYLRRRTNIAQWVPRGGLGRNGENIERLRESAQVFCDGGRGQAARLVRDYEGQVERSLLCLRGARQGDLAGKASGQEGEAPLCLPRSPSRPSGDVGSAGGPA